MRITLIIAVSAAVFVVAATAFAQDVSNTINYQGKLCDAAGITVPDGSYQAQFKLYTAETVGTLLWDSGAVSISTNGGIFTTELGPIASDDLPQDEVWLEVTVGADPPMPRVKLSSVPFALRAGDLSLPFARSLASSGSLLSVTNEGVGEAVRGENASEGNYGYLGGSVYGVYGEDRGTGNYGCLGSDSYGVTGYSTNASGRGVYGRTTNTTGRGVYGEGGYGNYGYLGSENYGVFGKHYASGNQGHIGSADYAVYGTSTSGMAGFFDGSAAVTGDLGVGTEVPTARLDVEGVIRSGTGGFKFPDGSVQTTAAVEGWSLTGNGGTTTETNFLGTTDDAALEFKVNGQRSLRLEPGAVPNTVGGWSGNYITEGVVGASVVGGGNPSDSSTKYNRVTDNFGFVGGGVGNSAGDGDATLTDAEHATVGGGHYNTASGAISTVGGGWYNRATRERTTIAGGWNNLANNHASTVGGGRDNTASGSRATVPGGSGNRAQGDHSFAAGRRAKADHIGTFVWADSTDADFVSTGSDQFLIRAGGGVGIGTNNPGDKLEVSGNIKIDGSGNGLIFHNGTKQTEAAVGDGHSLDTVDGSAKDALYVNKFGNVGIGTTSPGARLDVTDLTRVGGSTWPSSGKGLELGYSSSLHKGYVQVYDRGAGTWGNLYLGEGNVGIGTGDPGAKLDVETTSTSDAISASNTGNGSAVYATTSGNGHAINAYVTGLGWAGKFEINNASAHNAAVYGKTNGTGAAIKGETYGSGWAGSFVGTGVGNGVYISTPSQSDALNVVGGTKNAIVATSQGARHLYAEESSEVWFTDYGFGKLQDGQVNIAIDPLFAETVELDEPYHVFVQLNDPDCNGVAVTNRTAAGFDVVELCGGQSDAEFSYRVVAKRRGYAGTRLEPAPWADDDPNL